MLIIPRQAGDGRASGYKNKRTGRQADGRAGINIYRRTNVLREKQNKQTKTDRQTHIQTSQTNNKASLAKGVFSFTWEWQQASIYLHKHITPTDTLYNKTCYQVFLWQHLLLLFFQNFYTNKTWTAEKRHTSSWPFCPSSPRNLEFLMFCSIKTFLCLLIKSKYLVKTG